MSVALSLSVGPNPGVSARASAGASLSRVPVGVDLTDLRKKEIAMDLVSSAENSSLNWKPTTAPAAIFRPAATRWVSGSRRAESGQRWVGTGPVDRAVAIQIYLRCGVLAA